MLRRALTIAAVLLVACPGEPPPAKPAPPAPIAPPAPQPRTDGRLPALATPTRYAIAFDVDPAKTEFTGRERIDVTIPEATWHVVLHARDLAVTDARAFAGGEEVPAKWTSRRPNGASASDELVLTFARPLPPGNAAIQLAWRSSYGGHLSGLYRLEDGGKPYAFTQFEPTDARRAFPCFDEPSFKAPFEITVTAPRGMLAVANSPEASREETAAGVVFRFAPTPPLPTYLVAIAVGDFDVRESERTKNPKIRLVTTKGKTALGSLALEVAGELVDALEDTLGIPYPFQKLDLVAVPDFAAGAMENPGLLTFREERLLLHPVRASTASRRAQAVVIAHELAHQWFGNLVTAAWWNDLWLNEGMATWAEHDVLAKWRPQMGTDVDAVALAHAVMDLDGISSARAVRQPVESTGEAEDAFDAITYDKGAAVLRTIEHWIGREAFLRGIRDYLKEAAWTSVGADRLLTTLDRASGKNVTQMASGYLDKPGVPVVSLVLACEPGARWNAELTQEPWRPLGSKMPEESDRTWTIPVCVKPQGEKKSVCAELSMGAPSLVAGQGRCPAWVHPNAEGGYYRFALEEKELVRIADARAELDVPARVSLLSSAWASVRAGKLRPEVLLKVLPAFDDEQTRQAATQIVAILRGTSDALVEEDARPAFRKFAAARLAKRKRDLGWLPKRGESPDDALLRREVLAAMGDVAEDEATLREAEEYSAKWLADPASVDADTAAVAVDLATRRAGEARIAELYDAMKRAKTREDRLTALRATVGFDDPVVLGKALDATLGDVVHANEMRHVLSAVFSRRKARGPAEAWVRANWDALRKKLPGPLGRSLLAAVASACTKAEIAERDAFYRPRVMEIEGTKRRFDEVVEAASLCAELRASGSSSMSRALLNLKR